MVHLYLNGRHHRVHHGVPHDMHFGGARALIGVAPIIFRDSQLQDLDINSM